MAGSIFKFPEKRDRPFPTEKRNLLSDEIFFPLSEFPDKSPVKGGGFGTITQIQPQIEPKREERALFCLQAKLYRFDKDKHQWKERGVGFIKLLKQKQTGKARLVMTLSGTLQICANHLVLPSTRIEEHAKSKTSCLWHATEFADDGVTKEEVFFCARFLSIEDAKEFKKKIAEASGSQEESEKQLAAAARAANLNRDEDEDHPCLFYFKSPKEFKEYMKKVAEATGPQVESRKLRILH